MLDIRIIMNSAVEEILGFKTCCGMKFFDRNLEILIRNKGDRTVVVPGFFTLEGEHGARRIDSLFPHGQLRIEPGEVKAFYCWMDEALWNRSRRLVFTDTDGASYPVVIPHAAVREPAGPLSPSEENSWKS